MPPEHQPTADSSGQPSESAVCELTDDQRRNIVKDILNWKNEYNRPRPADETDLDAYQDRLESTDNSGLVDWWYQTVGEWIAARDGCSPPSTVSFDTYLQYQLGLVIDGEFDETDHGYLYPLSPKK